MTDYNKATNFATKDALVTGDPLKVVKGTEIDDELNAIEDAIETKANIASPTLTGIPKAPTAAAGTNTTQLATTAFVTTEVSNIDLTDSIGADEITDNSVGADELNVSGDGIDGQFLVSDGDGSFSWTAISVLSPAASDPTTRDDATALAEGDQYYNTTDNVIKTYDGSAWNAPVSTGFVGKSLTSVHTSTSTFTATTAGLYYVHSMRRITYTNDCTCSISFPTQSAMVGSGTLNDTGDTTLTPTELTGRVSTSSVSTTVTYDESGGSGYNIAAVIAVVYLSVGESVTFGGTSSASTITGSVELLS